MVSIFYFYLLYFLFSKFHSTHSVLINFFYLLTVVGNFPRLMKFGHYHAPKSWSLLHLLTWFFLLCQELSDEQLWPWVCVISITTARRQNSFVFKNGIFQQFSRSAVFLPSLYKKISMVKTVHHSIHDKIKKNKVNRYSRLQDLGAWKWPNFNRRGKSPTTVKGLERNSSLTKEVRKIYYWHALKQYVESL